MAIELNGVWWLEVRDVMELDAISRMEAYRRMNAWTAPDGPATSEQFYVWCEKGDARFQPQESAISKATTRGRLIDYRYLSTDAQQRWKRRVLMAAVEDAATSHPDTLKKVTGAEPQPGATGNARGQYEMFKPVTDYDRKLEAQAALLKASVADSQAGACLQRFKVIEPLHNHDWMARGHKNKAALVQAQARLAGVNPSTVLRWLARYQAHEDLRDLADQDPGPEKGWGSALDQSMRAHIKSCWEIGKLTISQTVASLNQYLEEKQRGNGPRHIYSVPHRTTVARYINNELQGDLNPIRRGEDFLHQYAGHIEREYDEAAGDAWCTDEWEMDVYVADRSLPRRVYNYGRKNPILHLLSYIDERTMFIMDRMLTIRIDADTPVLAERMVRAYWLPKRLVADRAGRFRALCDKHVVTLASGELMERITGPLGYLGVHPRGSEKKNPRANRIERMHGEYSSRARRDFAPRGSWRPPKRSRMREAVEIDARVQEHLRRRHASDPSSLIWFDELPGIVAKWIDEINDAATEAKGCHGMTRRQAFEYFQPPAPEIAGRRPSSEAVDIAFAERYKDRLILPGGTIELPDGLRYVHPLLTQYIGEYRAVIRLRSDHSKVSVLPDQKGEETIVAARRARVGCNDEDELAKQIALHARIKRATGPMVRPLEYSPESDFRGPISEASGQSTAVIPPCQPEANIGSIASDEDIPEDFRPRPRGLDFADLES